MSDTTEQITPSYLNSLSKEKLSRMVLEQRGWIARPYLQYVALWDSRNLLLYRGANGNVNCFWSEEEAWSSQSVFTPDWAMKLLDELPENIDLTSYCDGAVLLDYSPDGVQDRYIGERPRSAAFIRAVVIAWLLSKQP